MKNLFLSLLLIFAIMGCQSETTTTETGETTNGTEAATDTPQIDDRAVNDIINSIPSPLELSTLIKSLGAEYKKENLNNHEFVDNYTNNYRQALNLGVYSTDLGFANIYGKNQDVLNYLNSVKKIAEQLKIEEFFDYNTIKKLATNTDNLDSLLQITTSNFEKINHHLHQQNREHLSILILTGGWIEASYLTSLVYSESKNERLREKLGEQKIVLTQILSVLEVYKSKPNFSVLLEDLKQLNKAYEKVTISEESAAPQMVVENGEIVIKQNSKSTVTITDQDVEEISTLLRSIRNKLVK
jgi:uncharacterized protein YceK